MSFGWSVSDLYKLIELCRTIVVACSDGWKSAPHQLIDLRNDVAHFESLLDNLSNTLPKGSEKLDFDFLPIQSTLQNCRALLKNYTELPKQNGKRHATEPSGDTVKKSGDILSKSKDAAKKSGEVAKYVASGKKDVKQLRDKLAQHQLSLILYMAVLA